MGKVDKIKKSVKNNKTLVSNFSYLSILQIFNIALPLFTYPYLIKILGGGLYGTVIFAQAIIFYFSIVVNWGFEATATRDISLNRENKSKISEIISSVLLIKFFLWFICLVILLGLIFFTKLFAGYKLLYLFSFSLTFNELLFPVWYFQGKEKMKFITFINVGVRFLFLLLIFLFIKKKEDYILVPLFNGIGAFMGGIAGLYILFFKEKNKFVFQPYHILKSYIKESFHVFLSNLVISVKDKFSIIIIGSLLSMRDVAIFDLGVKLINVFIQPIMVANNAIYPRMSRHFNLSFLVKFIKMSFAIIFVGILLIQPFLSYILDFLTNNMEDTLLTSRIMLLSPLIMAISLPLARNCIVALGQYKYSFKSVIVTTTSYLVFIVIVFLNTSLRTVWFFALITVLTYLIELVYRIYVCKKIIIKS